ncbi:hypothetical protein LTR50_004951 [Elasticomyces elasticus]|nr:hypothetical protein LTR50_004951 [Elasticomyces elasticus]
MGQRVDVVICGSGSAGLCAAAWLARTGINCKILEKSSGPMQLGQADGVQCRTVEVFESFGLAEELLKAGYHVLEVAFWSSDAEGNLVRTNRTADTMPGLSHQPHVILNQARINGFLLDDLHRSNGQKVDYGYSVKNVYVDSTALTQTDAYPVTVTTEKDGVEEVFNAKYVLLIPREGGSLARFYIELPHGTISKDVKLEDLHHAARQIFYPYTLDIADTFWWSAYSIGQRLADHFSKDNRVFLTGDACHTHSPKAGQGMNVSLQDGYNIGWKLAAVLNGRASSELLKTYNLEREKVAADLIEFDRSFTKLFSSKTGTTDDHSSEYFSQQFIKSGRYTAGLTAKYDDSLITSAGRSRQELAKGLKVGMRFPSAQVVRFCDARAMQLIKVLSANGRWRIVVFAGNLQNLANAERLEKVGILFSVY